MKKEKIIAVVLLVIVTVVALLYIKHRGGNTIQQHVQPVSPHVSKMPKGKPLTSKEEKQASPKKIDPQDVLEPPFLPEWPLADISDAEAKPYPSFSGSYIYELLTGTTLNRVRKTKDKVYPGLIDIPQGKIALKEGEILVGAFIFDMNTLKLLGKDTDHLLSYLRSSQYLDVKKHPIASFILQEVKNNVLKGILTMRGVSKEIQFPALVLVYDDMISIRADFSIDRGAFGIPLAPGVDPFLDIHLQRILQKQEITLKEEEN